MTSPPILTLRLNFGLNRVCLIHYGVSDRFLCEVGGVSMWSDQDKFTSLKGVVVPDGLQVIQCQFGLAHLNTKPRDFRANHHLPEIPGIAKEGLTAFLYWGKKLLEECNMDFPGSHSKYGYVPYLHLYHEYPALHTLNDRHAGPDFGSVARGSI